jgi:Cu(I)/Ag(I) efflux system membrane fusion protein
MIRSNRPARVLIAAAIALAAAGTVSIAACRRGGGSASATSRKAEKTENAPVPTGGPNAAGRKVLYWYDPMVPGSKFDKPGKSPFMDMQLVPKYADEEGGASESAVKVGLSPEAIRATGVAVVPVEKATVSPEIRAVGTIETDETKLVRVAARVAGRIEKLYTDFTGQRVTAGAPLFDLYSPDLVATQREYLLALENRRKLAEGTPDAIRSAEDLVSATRDRLRLWGIAPSQIAALEKSGKPALALTYRSPLTGTVLQKMAVQGQYVTEGTELYLLADLSSVWLVAQVYEYELARLRVGQPAEVSVSGLSGETLSGRIVFIEPVLDRDTRSAGVRIVLPNPKGSLRPGTFANATIRLPAARRLVVPRSALIDTGTRRVVYVETSPNTFTARNVTPGSVAGDRVEIVEGLKEGERVVAQGNFFIDSQAQLAGGASVQWSGALDVKSTPTEPKP